MFVFELRSLLKLTITHTDLLSVDDVLTSINWIQESYYYFYNRVRFKNTLLKLQGLELVKYTRAKNSNIDWCVAIRWNNNNNKS